MSVGERTIASLVVAHAEAGFLPVAARSVDRAIAVAERDHPTWRHERHLLLDDPDPVTEEVGMALAREGWRVEVGRFGDPAPSRLRAAEATGATWIAFLDGDDLWGEAWLARCIERVEADPAAHADTFLHASYNLIFGAQEGLTRLGPDPVLGYLPAYQRVANYWDAMCFCARDLYLAHPMRPNRKADGFAHEDQEWARRSHALGVAHETVTDTIHFKRRRMTSVSMTALARDVRMHPDNTMRAESALHAPSLSLRRTPVPDRAAGSDLDVSHVRGLLSDPAPEPALDVPALAARVLAPLHPDERRLVEEAFDEAHYLRHSPDVRGAPYTPFEHYLARGPVEQFRDPSAEFSTRGYLEANPDVAALGTHPLVHWVLRGRAEGRIGNPPVAASELQRRARPILAALDAPTNARVRAGFDRDFYLDTYPDTASDRFEPLEHYLVSGWREGRDPAPDHATDPTRRARPTPPEPMAPLVDIALHGGAPVAWPERRECVSLDELRARIAALPGAGPGDPPVSAVLISYQHAPFLPERLRSIVEQTHRPAEIVVMDDASTDGSAELLREFAAISPVPVRLHVSERNAGSVYRQWRRGVEVAAHDLVWICESDDSCEDDLLARLVRMIALPVVGLAFGRTEFVRASGRPFGGASGFVEGAEPGLRWTPTVRSTDEWFAHALGARNVIGNVGACLMRRPMLPDEVWKAAESFRLHGDWFLYAHMAGEAIAYHPDALAWFRRHGANFTDRFQHTADFALDAVRFAAWQRGRFDVSQHSAELFEADLAEHLARREAKAAGR